VSGVYSEDTDSYLVSIIAPNSVYGLGIAADGSVEFTYQGEIFDNYAYVQYTDTQTLKQGYALLSTVIDHQTITLLYNSDGEYGNTLSYSPPDITPSSTITGSYENGYTYYHVTQTTQTNALWLAIGKDGSWISTANAATIGNNIWLWYWKAVPPSEDSGCVVLQYDPDSYTFAVLSGDFEDPGPLSPVLSLQSESDTSKTMATTPMVTYEPQQLVAPLLGTGIVVVVVIAITVTIVIYKKKYALTSTELTEKLF